MQPAANAFVIQGFSRYAILADIFKRENYSCSGGASSKKLKVLLKHKQILFLRNEMKVLQRG